MCVAASSYYHTYCKVGSISYQLVLNHQTLFSLQPYTTYQHAYDTNDSPVHASTVVGSYNLTPAHITLVVQQPHTYTTTRPTGSLHK